MRGYQCAALLLLAAVASAQITPQSNFLPVSFTVTSAPYDIIATPITPVAPYSQAAYQCNVTGDSRFPPYASGTFPLNLSVPVGQRVRVIFANGNLNGATVTQQGEPGVIVQQGGSPIVQQVGGASPIVQTAGSPIVQQKAPAAALVVQQTPTVVQQTYPQAPSIPNPPAVVQPSTPATTPASTPAATPAATKSSPPPPAATPAAKSPPPSPAVQTPPPTPAVQTPPPTPAVQTPPPTPAVQTPPPTPDVKTPPPSPSTTASPPSTGRKLLQDTVPGGPNNGIVEYVALASANTVPGFYAGSTQFGVPYVEFTASEAARGQVASFRGALEGAQVVGGVPIYPFTPNPSQSPECQVNVNFVVA